MFRFLTIALLAGAAIPAAADAQERGRGFLNGAREALGGQSSAPAPAPRAERPSYQPAPRAERQSRSYNPPARVQARPDRGWRGNRGGDVQRGWRGNVNGDAQRNWRGNRNGDVQRGWRGNGDVRRDWRADQARRGGGMLNAIDNEMRANGYRNGNRRDWDRNDRRRDWSNGRRWDGNRGWNGNRGAYNWNRGWRSDRRYNWQTYRNSNRYAFRLPRYYAPSGWDYGYRPFGIGATLFGGLFAQNYWIGDPWQYRLPPVEWPLQWVRYYDDALLVDTETGEVVDMINGIFW